MWNTQSKMGNMQREMWIAEMWNMKNKTWNMQSEMWIVESKGGLRNMARAERRLWPAPCLTLPCSFTHNICQNICNIFALHHTIYVKILSIYLLTLNICQIIWRKKFFCTHYICQNICNIFASYTRVVKISAMYLLPFTICQNICNIFWVKLLHTQNLSKYLQHICFKLYFKSSCFTHTFCQNILNF